LFLCFFVLKISSAFFVPTWFKLCIGFRMGAVFTLDDAIAARIALGAAGQTLVFTNGHFDLLHVGHLDYLEKARALGDALFVGTNGDSSTARLKGAGRPLVPAAERARLLAALLPVSGVIIFDDDTADELIHALRPDIYVKGGDYRDKVLPERPLVESYGGQIVLIDYLLGHSTSELIRRVKSLS
jgi:rfaE bifunctional protein nucleotidyltransferase chain/domain